jgi:hypothetical protein
MNIAIISIVISVISAFTALIALYHSYLKPAKIRIFASERQALWHDDLGRLCADISMNVNNEGSKVGIVQSVALVIKNQNIEDDSYLLRMDWFLKYNTSNHSWDVEGFPFPISINKGESVFKCIQFLSGPELTNWIPNPGRYELCILAWTQTGIKPDIKEKFEILIDQDTSEKIKSNLTQKTKNSIYVFRKEWGKWGSKKLSKLELEELIK